jgi:hypothetical protein
MHGCKRDLRTHPRPKESKETSGSTLGSGRWARSMPIGSSRLLRLPNWPSGLGPVSAFLLEKDTCREGERLEPPPESQTACPTNQPRAVTIASHPPPAASPCPSSNRQHCHFQFHLPCFFIVQLDVACSSLPSLRPIHFYNNIGLIYSSPVNAAHSSFVWSLCLSSWATASSAPPPQPAALLQQSQSFLTVSSNTGSEMHRLLSPVLCR